METQTVIHNYENIMHAIDVHPRVADGQVWQSNDNRLGRLRGVLVISANHYGKVLVQNVVTKRLSTLDRSSFRKGSRGWSLLKDVPRESR